MEHASDLILVLDAVGLVRDAVGAAGGLGLGRDALIGAAFDRLIHPEDAAAARHFLADVSKRPGGHGSRELRMGAGHDSWRTVEAIAANRLADPAIRGLVVTIRDVTERKALEEQLRHQAFHDPLTQLANRSLFSDRLSHAIDRHARSGRKLAVLFVDLDEFKRVNDNFGHDVGDQAMVAVARRLRDSLRAEDTAARLGGDEFAVLVEGADERHAVAVAERILAAFTQPFAIAGQSLTLGLSIGIAVTRATARSGSELLRNADLAMYMAKMTGRSRYEVFHESAEEALLVANRPGPVETGTANVIWLERAEEERAAVRALLEEPAPIRPVLQPIVELESGRIAGFEALARFDSFPDRPPNSIFAQAHRYGLGSFLEAKAIDAEINLPGRPAGAFLSLNVSPTALTSRPVQQALPESLAGVIVEMTENEVSSESPAVAEAVQLVRSRDGKLAIDDTGAGYAGLRHLMSLGPDLIKLDQTLIQNLHSDLRRAALVESLVHYAERISAEICAEGVESSRDLESLRELGVTYAQGNLLARPARSWTVETARIARVLGLTGRAPPPLQLAEAAASQARMAELLAAARTWEEVDGALELLSMTLAADNAYFSWVDERHGYLVMLAGFGRPTFDVPYPLADYPTTRAVLASQRHAEVRAGDPSADPREVEFLIAEGMRSGLLVPVVREGRSVGLLEIFSARERAWTDDELNHIGSACERLGEVLERLPAARRAARA